MVFSSKKISLVVLTTLLTACTQNPATVENKGIYTAKHAGSKALDTNPFKIKVGAGDNLYKISKKYGVEIRSLIEINRLRPPYILSQSQVLKLPKATFHSVKEGDTVFAISRSYGVDIGRLIHANNISKPYIIRSGVRLRIPSPTSSFDDEVVVSNEATNIQKKGQILASVVEKDLDKLDTRIESPKFVLPNKVKTESEFSAALMNGDSNLGKVDAMAPRPTLRASVYPSPVLRPGTEYAANATKRKFQMASYNYAPLKTGGGSFAWPAQGQIVSRFGPKKGGLYNDGINILAKEGAAIKAASDGTVVYSGNELRGYGNLVLLKHDNGYITAYAHAKNVSVKKGERVARGQEIASVGRTGHVSKPQLHFSIRKGRKAIDPEKYLPRG